MATRRTLGYVWTVRRQQGYTLLRLRLDDGRELWRRVCWPGVPTRLLLGRRCELVPWGDGLVLWRTGDPMAERR